MKVILEFDSAEEVLNAAVKQISILQLIVCNIENEYNVNVDGLRNNLSYLSETLKQLKESELTNY